MNTQIKTAIVGSALLVTMTCSTDRRNTNSANDSTRVEQSSPAADPFLAVTYEQRQGLHLYLKYCVVCHGKEGKGDGFNAFNLEPKPRNFTNSQYMNALTDERLMETISQGGRGVNKSVLMPSWGGRLTPLERTYVVAFIRYLGGANEQKKK